MTTNTDADGADENRTDQSQEVAPKSSQQSFMKIGQRNGAMEEKLEISRNNPLGMSQRLYERRVGHTSQRGLFVISLGEISHVSTACVPAGGHFDFVSAQPISRNPAWQVPTVPPKRLSSIIILAHMQSRWWRREHFDVGAAGGEQKAGRSFRVRAKPKMLDNSSAVTEGSCRTGFRDMEGRKVLF